MKVEFTHNFKQPREIVWKYIQDDQVLRKSLPGCKSFKEQSPGIYLAEMGLSIGPVKGLFTSEVQQVDREPPSSYRLLIKGKGKPGEIEANAFMKIDENEEGSKLICVAEVGTTGVLASAGQRVMKGVAKVILGQFFKSVEKEMERLVAQNK